RDPRPAGRRSAGARAHPTAVSALLANLLHFSRLLRAAGVDTPGGRMVDVASALEHVEIGRRSHFYYTLPTLLVHRHQDLSAFDQAFRLFWQERPGDRTSGKGRAISQLKRLGPPQVNVHGIASDSLPEDATSREPSDEIAPMSYSSQEALRVK